MIKIKARTKSSMEEEHFSLSLFFCCVLSIHIWLMYTINNIKVYLTVFMCVCVLHIVHCSVDSSFYMDDIDTQLNSVIWALNKHFFFKQNTCSNHHHHHTQYLWCVCHFYWICIGKYTRLNQKYNLVIGFD